MVVVLLLGASRAPAQTPILTSAKPDAVGVSIYRNPHGGGGIDLNNLGGFALITETRTVDLPPGPVTIRFEGVASGIQPRTALMIGIDAREKNRDGALLSQRGLLDAFTGQRVILKRTDRATGKVSEEVATIRSAPDGIIVQTVKGFEPLYCTGLSETLLFPGVPRNLSAKPTLSMTTKDQPGGKRRITLAYLASGFDWRANYVAQFNEEASAIDLFAWLTMASSDDTNFESAQAAAIAGTVNREESEVEPETETRIDRFYNCWPPDTVPTASEHPPAMVAIAPAPVATRMADLQESAPMIVTASKVAKLEVLGDLKLYRIPMPVTVAARAQKQVAFLAKPRVKGRLIYRTRSGDFDSVPNMLFRFKNDKASGLGDPLPAGGVALFQSVDGRQMLMGESRIDDKASEEEVNIVFGGATHVTTDHRKIAEGTYGRDRSWTDYALTVRNAHPVPVQFEAEFETANTELYERFSSMMSRRPGKVVWIITVPANSMTTLRYRAVERQ